MLVLPTSESIETFCVIKQKSTLTKTRNTSFSAPSCSNIRHQIDNHLLDKTLLIVAMLVLLIPYLLNHALRLL